MLDALIFDLDGTLIDSNGLHARAFEQAFADEGFRVPADRVLPEIGKGADLVIESIAGKEVASSKGEALKRGHKRHVLRLIEEEGVKRLPGAIELLRAVRAQGLKVAIATAASSEVRDALTRAAGLDLDELADAVLTDSDVEESKPAPDTVEAAVAKLGLGRGVCGFVGDTPYDALSARRAGLTAVAIANPAHPADRMRRHGMRAHYRHPADLLDHLDAVLERLSPGPHRLTDGRLDALMHDALEEADAGAADDEIPIGALVARPDGTVLGRAHHRTRGACGLAHAAIEALRGVEARSAGARDLVLVSTLEPCPMCLGAALEMGVDTVVFALESPEQGGTERIQPAAHGACWPRVIRGVQREASRTRLEAFAVRNPDVSFVQRLLAASSEQDT